MSNRHGSLEYNLSLLQDCIRRDPESYKDEFLEQYRHFEHTIQLFRLQPSLDPSRLLELVNFHSHVAHCYPNETKKLPEELMELLTRNADALHPHLRIGLAKAVALLRNKNLASPLTCLELFFELSKCRDKELRKFLFTSTVQYVKLLNTKRKDAKVNSQLQNFILSQLQRAHSSKVVARMALLLLIDLYRRRVWTDAKTVNAIALGGCLSSVTKLSATACKFFLGNELDGEDKGENSDEEEENKATTTRTIKEVMVGYRAGKKTKNRQKALERARRAIDKVDKNRNKKRDMKDVRIAALRLLYDPQEFAERLFRKLEQKSHGERFEFRLLIMALLARVIGLHKLQVLNFYTYILRYLQPRQPEVTKMLLFAAQSSHELVPPDSIEAVVRTIVDNFVTDRNSPEAITVGLNACREILANCPLAVGEDLLRDLVDYKKYRNKNVSMAARGLIQVFRHVNPELLHKRDRGRPTEADKEYEPVKSYGESRPVPGFIPGAECLTRNETGDIGEGDQSEGNEGSSDDDPDDMEESSLDEDELEEGPNQGEISIDQGDGMEEKTKQTGDETGSNQVDTKEVASLVSATRIFSQEDFRRIRKHQLKKHLEPYRKRKLENDSKKNRKTKRRRDDPEVETLSDVEESGESEEEEEKGELPTLADIEHFHKRAKMDREMRIASVKAGREGREKFGRPEPKGPHVGRTNQKLARNKPFTMVRRKEAKKMKRRSFREKQQALKNYLVNQKKMR